MQLYEGDISSQVHFRYFTDPLQEYQRCYTLIFVEDLFVEGDDDGVAVVFDEVDQVLQP